MQGNIPKNKIPDQPLHCAPPLVSIVVVQYNNSQDTMRCLNSVKELDFSTYTVTVVDNASTVKDFNATRLFIESMQDKRFKIIQSDKNLGYSGGNNLGIKMALAEDAAYVFILNPDTTIEKDALTKLVRAVESDPEIGILGPAINENGTTVYGGRIEWLKSELRHLPALAVHYYVPGAAMLIKRTVVKKIGWLDKRYFLYFEDADYCLRAQKAGYELAIIPEAKVAHAVSASTSQLGSPLLLRYHYRNAHLFNWKNGPRHIKIALPFWSIFIIIKQWLKIIFVPAKREISKAILAGVGDFYRSNWGKIRNSNLETRKNNKT